MAINPPDHPNQGPAPENTPPIVPPGGQANPDVVAQQRQTADLTNTIQGQMQGTQQLLNTMVEQMGELKNIVTSIPQAFESSITHIQKSTKETEKLAQASKKVADEQERGAKANRQSSDEKEKEKNNTFSIHEVIKNLAGGNLQGAIGEAFQGIPGRFGQQALRDRAATLSAAGVARGGMTGGLMRGGAMALAGASGLMTPAAIYGAYRLFNTLNAQQQETQRIGALTGEGRGAGIAAEGINLPIFGHIGGEVGTLRRMGGAFDLVGDKEAQEIVQGVRGEGFRGDSAGNVEQAIAGMVDDLGIGVQDAMKIAIPAIKEAGFSTTQLSVAVGDLDDQAKASHTSVTELTNTLGTLIQQTAAVSRVAARAVPGQQAEILRQFVGTPLASRAGVLRGAFGPANIQALATLQGVSPLEVANPAFIRTITDRWIRTVSQIAAGHIPGQSWEVYATYVLQNPLWAQLFTSVNPSDVALILKRYAKLTHNNTQTDQFIQQQDQQENQARISRAARSANSISDQFSGLMGRKVSLLTGSGIFGSIFGNSGGVDRSLIRKAGLSAEQQVAQILINLGINKEDRQAILQPIIEAAKAGNRSATEKSLAAADDVIKQYQQENKIHIHSTIGFDSRSARMLKSLNTGSIEALRGQRGTQGVSVDHG